MTPSFHRALMDFWFGFDISGRPFCCKEIRSILTQLSKSTQAPIFEGTMVACTLACALCFDA